MSEDVLAWIRWAITGMATVVVTVLGLAWRGLNARVDSIHAETTSNTAAVVLHSERITRTEERVLTHMDADERAMTLLNSRLDRMEMKLDSILAGRIGQ